MIMITLALFWDVRELRTILGDVQLGIFTKFIIEQIVGYSKSMNIYYNAMSIIIIAKLLYQSVHTAT